MPALAFRIAFIARVRTRAIAVMLLASVVALSSVPALAHQITSVEPSAGGYGTVIVIHGSGFGDGSAKKPGVELTGGATRARLKVLSASDTKIVARVKKGPVGVWDVTVRALGSRSVAPQAFTVGLPNDLTLDRQKAAPGETVTVSGHDLGGNRGFVRVGSWYAAIVSRQESGGRESFVFRIPTEVPKGTYDVQVGNPIGTVTLPAALKVKLSSARIDNEAPKVASAGATSSTEVVVQFTEPVRGGADYAENPAYYRISAAVEGAIGASTLEVTEAALVTPDPATGGSDRVRLTTLSQSNLRYTVKVVGVVDLAGNPLAGPSPLTDPTVAEFQGIDAGPEVPDGQCDGTGLDKDCDGLSDAVEQRGWFVQVTQANGNVVRYLATSNPRVADTDGDLLDDRTELEIASNPRVADTDGDTLGDYQEFNEVYSDASSQDSDGDSLDDGLEFGFFRTSPIQADTDGDETTDGDEIAVSSRNPLVAELPTPAIEVGGIDLRLDVRFTEETSRQKRELQTKSVSTTLEQSNSSKTSTSDKDTHEFAAKLTVGTEWSTKATVNPLDSGAKFKTSVQVEAGYTGTWEHESSQESSAEARQEYAKSLQTEAEVTAGATVTREVVGARMQAAVLLRDVGGLAFRVRNLQLTAFSVDPRDPTRFTPIATLLPDAEPQDGFALGPLQPVRGPVVFSNDTIFPSLVEELMRNPRGLVFRISNFDITDEQGRNFVFSGQDIVERTAALVIDYGTFDGDGDGVGDRSEIHRIATSAGRVIDTNGDGNVDANDHRVVFDGAGKQVGITLREALAAIGISHLDEALTPTCDASSPPQCLPSDELENSYSTVRTAAGVERVFRVRGAAYRNSEIRAWEVITSDGYDHSLGIDSIILRPGQTVRLAFLQDLDADRLESRLEELNGCLDAKKSSGAFDPSDTDGDGLDDRFEVMIGWDVDVTGRGIRHVYARCNDKDTDGDGLTDYEEAPDQLAKIDTDGDGTPDIISSATSSMGHHPTDPGNPDTDGDGVSDFDEVSGYPVTLKGACHPRGGTRMVTTDPTDADTDDDGASDGVEKLLGGDPNSEADMACFGDDDGDGLANAQEEVGWDVEVEAVSVLDGSCDVVCGPGLKTTRHVVSKKNDRDSDDDGVLDDEEFRRRTDPNEKDTDGDGIPDLDEIRGYVLRDLGVIFTRALDADTDDDKRSDGDEAEWAADPNARWVVRATGKSPYRVYSDPLEPDADSDRLVDGDERVAGTDPQKSNTDEDLRDDYVEVKTRTNPLVPDFLVTVTYDRVEFPGRQCDNINDEFEKNDAHFEKGPEDYRFDLGVIRPGGNYLQVVTSDPTTPMTGITMSECADYGEIPGGCWAAYNVGLGGFRKGVPGNNVRFVQIYEYGTGKVGLRRSQGFSVTAFDEWSLGGQIHEYDAFDSRLDGLDLTERGPYVSLFTATTPGAILPEGSGTPTVNLFSGALAQNGVTFFRIEKRGSDCGFFNIFGTITVSGLQF